jgi:hypothetical protein
VFYFGDLKKLPIFGKLLTRNALFSHGDYVNLTRAKDAIRIHAEALLRDAKSSKAARHSPNKQYCPQRLRLYRIALRCGLSMTKRLLNSILSAGAS